MRSSPPDPPVARGRESLFPFTFCNAPILDGTAMDRWLAQFETREHMAVEYARILREKGLGWPGYGTLNLAIMDRWSKSGLTFIKDKAWRIFNAG